MMSKCLNYYLCGFNCGPLSCCGAVSFLVPIFKSIGLNPISSSDFSLPNLFASLLKLLLVFVLGLYHWWFLLLNLHEKLLASVGHLSHHHSLLCFYYIFITLRVIGTQNQNHLLKCKSLKYWILIGQLSFNGSGCNLSIIIHTKLLFSVILCLFQAVMAAAMTDKSPFVVPLGKRDQADAVKKAMAVGASDHITIYKAYAG